ncbi:MAG: hypothetical protein ACXWTP_01825 [Methylosarcina sp.]
MPNSPGCATMRRLSAIAACQQWSSSTPPGRVAVASHYAGVPSSGSKLRNLKPRISAGLMPSDSCV